MGLIVSFMFVIFVGGFYLIKYISESIKHSGYKGDLKKHRDNAEEFEKRVCNRDLEEDIRLNIESFRKEADDLTKGLWWSDIIEHDYDYAYRVILASHGNLSWTDANIGINPFSIKTQNKKVKHIDSMMARAAFVLWINEQLNKHGVSTRVVVGNRQGGKSTYRVLTEDNLYQTYDVSYEWEQTCVHKVA